MTTPSEPPEGAPDEPVDLGKHQPEPEAPFDPYRFGLPETPPPPEYAPPGWTPQPVQPPPPPSPPPAWGPPYPPYPYGTSPYNTSPYGTTPWGAPGQPPPYYAPRRSNGKAVAALVLGIVSILLFFLTVFDAVLVIPAVVFGILGLNDARSSGGTGRGMAIGGLVCAGVGAVLAIVWTAVVIHVANECGGLSQSGQPGFQQCLQHHLMG